MELKINGEPKITRDHGGQRGKVVAESDQKGVKKAEESDEIIIEVRIPKPEVLIFSDRMKTKYDEIGYRKSFAERICDPENIKKLDL